MCKSLSFFSYLLTFNFGHDCISQTAKASLSHRSNAKRGKKKCPSAKRNFENIGAASLSQLLALAKTTALCLVAASTCSKRVNAPIPATTVLVYRAPHVAILYVHLMCPASRPSNSFCPVRARPSHGPRTPRIARIRNAQATTLAAVLELKRMVVQAHHK